MRNLGLHWPSVRRMCGILLLAVAVLYASASPPIPPESFLRSVGLLSDDEAVIGYLQNGFPSTAKWPDNSPRARYATISNAYSKLRELIESKHLNAAVTALRKLVQAPLPPLLHDAFVASEAVRRNASAELEFAVEAQTMSFQGSWAYTLAKLGDTEASDIIKDRIKSTTQTVYARLAQQTQGHSTELTEYVGGYVQLCSALAGLGDKDGVQFLIATLPHLQDNPDGVVGPLRFATGQNFGPDWDLPRRLQDAEKEKWYAWWATNKTTFQPKTEYILYPFKYRDAQRTPQTVRDYVDLARDSLDKQTDTYIPSSQEAATEWLSSHAERVVGDLTLIINNPDERLYVRVKAMKWYARGIRYDPLPLLTKYVRKRGSFDPADAELADTMAREAKALVLEYYPKSRLGRQIANERAR